MAEPAQSLGFNVVDYIFVLYQFVQFFIVFNPSCLIFFRGPKYCFLGFSSQRLAVSELYFLSTPMFLMHRSLFVLLLFCIILILNF